jgi:hypothetical protein
VAGTEQSHEIRRNERRKVFYISNAVAIAATVGAAISVIIPKRMIDVIGEGEVNQSNQLALSAEIVKTIGGMRHDIASLKQEQIALQTPPEGTVESAQFRSLDERLTQLDQREAKLEQVIMDNPAKALEVPLLQRDVENDRKSAEERFTSIKADNDRVYDQMKWVFGFFFTGLIALIVSNLGSFITKKKAD